MCVFRTEPIIVLNSIVLVDLSMMRTAKSLAGKFANLHAERPTSHQCFPTDGRYLQRLRPSMQIIKQKWSRHISFFLSLFAGVVCRRWALSLASPSAALRVYSSFWWSRNTISALFRSKPKARRYDVFIVALSQLTGEKEIPGEMFCPGNRRCRPGAGVARLSLGVAGCQKITACLLGGQGCHRTAASHLQCHRMGWGDSGEKLGVILGKTRASGGTVLYPLHRGSWSLLKQNFAQHRGVQSGKTTPLITN